MEDAVTHFPEEPFTAAERAAILEAVLATRTGTRSCVHIHLPGRALQIPAAKYFEGAIRDFVLAIEQWDDREEPGFYLCLEPRRPSLAQQNQRIYFGFSPEGCLADLFLQRPAGNVQILGEEMSDAADRLTEALFRDIEALQRPFQLVSFNEQNTMEYFVDTSADERAR